MQGQKEPFRPKQKTSSSSRTSTCFALFVLLVTASSSFICFADAKKDRNQPHGHTGKLTRYTPGPLDDVKLTAAELSKLESGQAVMKQTLPSAADAAAGGGGSAICVQDIAAPKQAVWSQILDLNAYTGKVSKVKESRNYLVKRNPAEQTVQIKTKMVLGVMPGYAYEAYYDHTYHADKDSMCWTLDYDKTSDFDDVAGHWHVESLAPSRTRVYYACDIKMKGSVPGPILNYISKAALKQATGWVKKESEAAPTKNIPAEYNVLSSPSQQQQQLAKSKEGETTNMPRAFAFGGGGAGNGQKSLFAFGKQKQ